jgi:DNA-binding transcriptional MerR regulator
MSLRTESRYLTVGQAAEALDLPGPWTLRRLEARGVIPAAPRAERSRDRYYEPETVERIAVALVRHRVGAQRDD